MDNEQLLDKVQNVIFGMEERINSRFDRVETRLDRIEREMALTNEILAPFIKWSHAVENEVTRISAELAEVRQRLDKLENPNAA